MGTQTSSREWMHALARLRAQLVRLREQVSLEPSEALGLAEAALQLTDTMRGECAALQQRCAEAEQHLRTVDTKMRAVLDLVPGGVVTTDATGAIVDTNNAAVALLGRSAARLRGELLLHFFEDRAGFNALLRSLSHAATPVRAVFRLRPRERAPFDADLTVARDPRAVESRWLWFMGRASEPQKPVGINGGRAVSSSPFHPDAA